MSPFDLLSLLFGCTSCSGPIATRYNPQLVALSVIVAVFASYAALDLVARVATSVGLMRRAWVAAGSVMMGLGIWSMHFVGMLALVMEMPVTYDVPTTVLSMVLAIAGSLAALLVATRTVLTWPRLLVGGTFMGAAINAMHYTGMAGMRMQARLSYDPLLFAASVVIAVVASVFALKLALHLRTDASLLTRRRAVGAVAMGVAIAGMHYTGMAAAVFTPVEQRLPAEELGIGISYLGATAIGFGTLFGLGLTLLSSVVDRERRRALKSLQFLADAGAVLNVLDERRILESTARLLVPNFADHCVAELHDGAGGVTRTIAGHVRGRVALFVIEGAEAVSADHPLAQASEVGASTHTIEPTGARWMPVAGVPVGPEHAAHHAPRSILAIPVRAGDHRFGALLLTTSERHFLVSELLLAEEVGKRVGSALEMSRLVRELQKSVEARDHFLSVAAHELRTPLTPLRIQIQSLLHLAREGQLPQERLVERLGRTDKQVTRFARLVEQLLDISRLTEDRLQLVAEPLDVAAVVRDIADVFALDARRSQVPLDVICEDSIPAELDRLRLEEILTNLLSNALKYGDGGRIEVGARREGEQVLLWIRDEGIGIAAEDHERIFSRFERAVSDRHYGGLGLGLWIVRELVQAMGGTIDVQSEPGRGSTFSVRLPLRRSAE